jgi:hypothetical protein
VIKTSLRLASLCKELKYVPVKLLTAELNKLETDSRSEKHPGKSYKSHKIQEENQLKIFLKQHYIEGKGKGCPRTRN